MKIQYVLIKVVDRTRYLYSGDDQLEVDVLEEVEIVRKDTEQEVEEWLQESFDLIRQLSDLSFAYTLAETKYKDSLSSGRSKRNSSDIEKTVLLGELTKKAEEEYCTFREKYPDIFDYGKIDMYAEYRIVKVYSFN